MANLAHLAFSVKRSRFQHFLRHVYTFLESSDQDELNAVPLSYAALVFAEKKRIMHVCTFLTFLIHIWCFVSIDHHIQLILIWAFRKLM